MEKIQLEVGGQAVIEGVLFKTKHNLTLSVRQPNHRIRIFKKKLMPLSEKYKFLGWPFIRGVVILIETIVLGIQALTKSANEIIEEKEEKIGVGSIAVTLLLAVVFTLLVFKLLPLAFTWVLSERFSLLKNNSFLFSLIDGATKIMLFLFYVLLISKLPDIRRIFQYHGAEHKAVYCYESGKALTVRNAKNFSTKHARCGTSFIFLVIILSILVYTLIPVKASFAEKFFYRILLLPVIAGISYEFLKISARFHDKPLFHLLTMPGLWFQYITTKEPNDEQLEVAVKGLKKLMELEKQRSYSPRLDWY